MCECVCVCEAFVTAMVLWAGSENSSWSLSVRWVLVSFNRKLLSHLLLYVLSIHGYKADAMLRHVQRDLRSEDKDPESLALLTIG